MSAIKDLYKKDGTLSASKLKSASTETLHKLAASLGYRVTKSQLIEFITSKAHKKAVKKGGEECNPNWDVEDICEKEGRGRCIENYKGLGECFDEAEDERYRNSEDYKAYH